MIPTTRVDLLIDRAWSNITADVYARDAVTITRGRGDAASTADPSTCNVTVNNRSGKYSPRNVTSSLFGKIGRNTPLRFGVGTPPVSAVTTSSSATTNLVAPSVTAEASGLLLHIWAAKPVGDITVPAGTTGDTETDAVMTVRRASRAATAGATGTATATTTVSATDHAALSVHIPGGALGANAAASSATGGDATVTGPAAAEGDLVVAFCGWSADPTGRMQPPRVSTPVGAGWLLVADTGPSAGIRLACWVRRAVAAETATTRLEGAGNAVASGATTGTYLSVSVVTAATAYYPRHIGEIAAWPQRWEAGGRDAWSPLTSSGVLRRLGQGGSQLRSAMVRLITPDPNVVAYWPMEDAEGSASFASPIAGVSAGTWVGAAPVLAADDTFDGSEPLPTWEAAGFKGSVPSYVSTEQLFAGGLFAIPATGTANGANLLSVGLTGGTIGRAILEYRTTGTGTLALKLLTGADVVLLDAVSTIANLNGARFFAWFTLNVSGADVACQVAVIRVADVAAPPIELFTTTLSGGSNTVGVARQMVVGVEGGASGTPSFTTAVTAGHIVVGKVPATVFRTDSAFAYPAVVGHTGEAAAERIRRLCTEEGVACYVPHGGASTVLGPQRPGMLLDHIDQAAASDGGILYEPVGFIGLAYRPRESLYSQRGV